MLKMATLSLKTDLHSLFERLNDSFAKMLVNLPGIFKDFLFQLLQSCGFVFVNTVFEMPPKEKSHMGLDQVSVVITETLL